MQDASPWTDAAPLPPDWGGETRVRFDPDDPAKTIPLSWAQDYLQREYKRNPPQFGARLGEVVKDWAKNSYQAE